MRKKAGFTILTLFLITVIFFCFSQVVYSQSSSRNILTDREGTDLYEKELISQIRNVMEEYGCIHSGITMTKIYSAEGERSYQILIHHSNLAYLSLAEKENLISRLKSLEPETESVTFTYELTYL
ncbi:MAG: hypothetical protein J1E61_10275 [Lachnospiraceae bacterium]|nr:hypothetical protein [Lachnospiraceae bacterium]